ncbi:D-methionine transport system substrate-binding protein [Devosia crocina]|uniref:D-methionine transport system substrate-binding protein n=1 Tax=Devosia crocina TaxID=429728 RepID=A0A1I7NQV7_9HYPH|nr:MetQ/NlpA family ABC transporter substrate-binding protein [Devosia crocina]SFV37077.1 D-methionine transport system substrate-binding protein [Devosia crocina]
MTIKALSSAVLLATALLATPALAETIRIGATPGPHAQILEAVKPILAEQGYELEILEFSDYVIPNEALASGDLNANSFQHQPYLDNQVRDRGYAIESVATTVNFPIGIYSDKVENIADLPEGAKIGIPNDPTNGGRVLLLLEDNGLLDLTDGVGTAASVADIIDNPKNFEIIEVDAAQLPRVLPDVDAAGINTNFAEQAGLDPINDPILREDAKGPYVNVIAVRSEDKDQPWVKALVDVYHSDEIRTFVETTFNGAVLASW